MLSVTPLFSTIEPLARDSPSDCAPLSLDWVLPQLELKEVPTDGDLAVHGHEGALLLGMVDYLGSRVMLTAPVTRQ